MHRAIFFLLYIDNLAVCTHNHEKARNDIITIENSELTYSSMGCSFVRTLRVVYFSVKHLWLHVHVYNDMYYITNQFYSEKLIFHKTLYMYLSATLFMYASLHSGLTSK